MLELKHISYSVRDEGGELGILKDIDLAIPEHKLVVLTGPNGGGKTTLAKIIMGLVQPTDGQILWNGEDVTHMTITERAKRGISYGFQQPARFKGITVRNLLTIAAGDEKLSKDRCCQYLTRVGLCANDYLDREVDTSLSGGEVKRIEIATILARGSQLMIFDEPEAGIDLWSFARLTETFEQIHKEGKVTMVIISHQERIISLADEVIVVGRRNHPPPRIRAGDSAPDSGRHTGLLPGTGKGGRALMMDNEVDRELLEKIADLIGKPVGAFNIRKDSGCDGRQSTEHIEITGKTDKPGIDIRIKDGTKDETCHIPGDYHETRHHRNGI
jgi:Fe-S cluster assembly ATP-binding protein